MTNKTYLGDAVYADVENGMVKLTTEDGISITNTIFLEPQVLASFFKYAYGLEFASSIRQIAREEIVSSQRREIERLKGLLEKAGIHDY